uniref:piggyBac transposable element-derived protein 4-like n=1 Tax=Epinephelus lanceolatus TaxID=310571 RepID=UPI0014487D96|nr:piggyBac transposable element-derived protein 4-like [Epinephelus lanceolatus]
MEEYDTATDSLELIWNLAEEECNQKEPAEIDEEVSEEEDNTEQDLDYASTDEEEDPSDEDIREKPTNDNFKSKDGNMEWSAEPPIIKRGMHRAERLRGQPGPTLYAVSRVDTIKSAFELFITPSIENIVLDMTNLEGRRVFGTKWTDLDRVDLQAYFGLLILAGVFRSCKEASASLWDAQHGRAIFRATMPLKMFYAISRVIRFDNRETRKARRGWDKLAAIRDVWDKWVCRLQLIYNAGADVTVDERLVSFRGCCAFKQYIPSKPGKYGIKIWTACDARSSYALNMQVYTGKPADGQPEKNQGMRVVLEMTEGLKGRNITCDNFFTSYALGQKLLKRKMTMVGTVRKTKAELPMALLVTKGRTRFSSRFAFTDTHALVSYLPKRSRNVLLMSTLHKDAAVSNREDKKPHIILDYNKNKGGVDNLDKVTAVYSCKRMTARWPLVVFHNILDVTAYNSFVLWTEINPAWHPGKSQKRRLFLEALGRELVEPLIKRRRVLPRTPASVSVVLDVQRGASSTSAGASPSPSPTKAARPSPIKAARPSPIKAPPPSPSAKRKRCRFCPSKKDNKTSIRCQKCCVNICKKHTITLCHLCR